MLRPAFGPAIGHHVVHSAECRRGLTVGDPESKKRDDDASHRSWGSLDLLVFGGQVVIILLLPALLLAVYLGWISVFAFASLAAPLLLLASIGWMLLLAGRGIHRSKRLRELRTHEYRICQACGYLLVGLPDDGNCPECGSSYDRQETIRSWQNRLLLPWRLTRRWEWRIKRGPLERLGFLALSCAAILLLLCVVGWFVADAATNLRLILLTLSAGISGAFLLTLARRRIRKIVIAQHNRVCPWCLGELRNGGDRGECSRCGIPFAAENIEAIWAQGYLRIPWRLERTRPRGPKLPPLVRASLIVLIVSFLLSAGTWHWWYARGGTQPTFFDAVLRVGMIVSLAIFVIASICLMFAVAREGKRD